MNEIERVEENPPRLGTDGWIYIIPSLLTVGNIVCGVCAVINSLKGFQAHHAEASRLFDNAARAIGYAVLLDGLDGRIARMTKTTSEFGVELDSIADVITFGVAPAVMAYTWGYGSTPGLGKLAWVISFIFLICGALRLARFNVMARAPRFSVPGNTPKLDKRYFVGLPIPPAAGLLAAVIHFIPRPLTSYEDEQFKAYSWALLVGMTLLAVLMVSKVRYTSFKNVGSKSNKPFIILPLLSLLVAGIWFYSQWVLLVIALAYVSHGPLLKVWGLSSRFRPQSSKTEESASETSV